MKARTPPAPVKRAKRDAVFHETNHDSYKSKRKPVSPSVCPKCQALYQGGRWQWAAAPAAARSRMCPACHRMQDDFPAGYVTLKGTIPARLRNEVLHLVHNIEAREKREHPMQRIMKITEGDEGLLITTTDIHLARGIGHALHHAYRGKLDYHYNSEQNLLRVLWER